MGPESKDTLNYWNWLKQVGLLDQAHKDFNCEFGKNPTDFTLGISSLPPEGTMEAFTAQQTVEFLKSAKSKGKPFFAWSQQFSLLAACSLYSAEEVC